MGQEMVAYEAAQKLSCTVREMETTVRRFESSVGELREVVQKFEQAVERLILDCPPLGA